MFAFVFEFSVGRAMPNIEGRISPYEHENCFRNIERRISLYDRNYVLRLVFIITTFFAGKWDLQGRVPTKSLEHPYML